MTKRNKVIRGLECCEKKVCIYKETLKECPYWELCGEHEGAFEDCTTALAKDAIDFVKAQEPNPMPGAELTDAELMDKVRKAPIVQQTADAIPVEWIENRLNAMLNGPASAESCFAVLLLLADWMKEQAGGGRTMADLISRAALLKECAECQKTDPHFEEHGWANHFINSVGEPSTEWYCVEDMIENAPAIDAIPVEWLKDKAKHSDSYTRVSAKWMLGCWKREQEGRT